ncbi:uncharacterized protein LOC124190933 isoform X1 [Daphnia pulex]|uniref:uncharacterized protein LOC124190933 isoform X1 n=2 Tax=Daphnia pulex TaxID=6669 RepID=UPI001EDECB8D|nr:uncharacterized protein LOC124190933 isoform X1 [Daphnia pulex]
MSMSAGGLAAAVCIAVGFSIGLMKTLFPSVYDLIGSSCLVLVGMSLLVVCLIFCAAPYMHCFNSPPKKIEIDSSIQKIDSEFPTDGLPPTYEESEMDFTSESDTSSTDKTSIFDSKSAIVEISYSKEPPAPVITPPPSLAQMSSVAIDMEMT